MGADYFPAENKDNVTIRRGQLVAIHSSGTGVVRANASDDLRNAVGLMAADTAVGATQNVMTDEVFTLADWSEVAGTVQLQGGKYYYLDTTSGHMALVSPQTTGQVSQIVGRAVSPLALAIEIEEAILL